MTLLEGPSRFGSAWTLLPFGVVVARSVGRPTASLRITSDEASPELERFALTVTDQRGKFAFD